MIYLPYNIRDFHLDFKPRTQANPEPDLDFKLKLEPGLGNPGCDSGQNPSFQIPKFLVQPRFYIYIYI